MGRPNFIERNRGLKFNIKTTKEDQWGTMTPTYFCLDGITIED